MSNLDDCPVRTGEILFGKYRVEEVLGRGGMGVVVAARHLTLGERAAIKFLLPAHAGNPGFVERFLREARAAVRIRSQHVARVSDVGTMENGAPYMILEHLQGENLATLVRRDGALEIGAAIELVLQACEALAEAHSLGIVHRDVKPANLFLTHHADGRPCVKVLDFGISKMIDADEHALTQTGAVLGSPLYMAPEQIRSARDVDARADVYATGVVLYELLTGRVPFTAGDLPQLVYAIMNEAPRRPRELRAELPAPLEEAMLRAIARDREVRFESVGDLASALAPFAPARARDSVERICGVLRAVPREAASTRGRESAGVDDATRVASGDRTALTSTGTATEAMATMAPLGTTNAPPSRRSARGIAGGMIVAAIALLGVVALWSRAARAPSIAPLSIAAVTEEPTEATKGAASAPPRAAEDTVPAPLPPAPPIADGGSPVTKGASPLPARTAKPAASAGSGRVKNEPFDRGVF